VADESVQVEPSAEPASPPATPTAPRSRSDIVLDRYRADMRRSRIVYAAIVAVIIAGLGTWVFVTWSRGEAAHASLNTATSPPLPLRLGPPSPTQQEAWRTSDRIALGTPQFRGTVITYSVHTVGGRNARTGSPTWSYTRTDRTVCTAAQLTDPSGTQGTTIAVYRNKGNCDEVSAFNTQTGQRRWTRTLDMDAMPLNGTPSYQVTADTMLLASPSVIYAIDPLSGLDRWSYYRFGCTIDHVVLGDAGALISQTCSSQVDCTNEKYCARGLQLTLRNGSDGRDDNAKDLNHDKIIWNHVGNSDIPVSADGNLVSAVDPSGATLHAYDPAKGAETGTIPLSPATAQLGGVSAVSTTGGEIVWLAGRTYAIGTDQTKPLWQADSSAPPSVQSTTSELTPALSTARITVPVDGGVGILDGSSGKQTQQFSLGAPPSATAAYSLGTGFLVAGATGAVAYR
jgi:hypothetical protein